MYKNFLINYAKKLKKEDLYNFKIKNNIDASEEDITTIYNHIKNYSDVFFDDPLKYINMLKNKVSGNVYEELIKYYEKYKNYI